jgi:DNA replication and repair protein RecF
MQLNHLSLTHFRNFTRLDFTLTDGVTILVGANAQGKTSLLDAIHYLTAAQSPHTSNDRHLIHFNALQESPPFARIVAEIQRNSIEKDNNKSELDDRTPKPLRIEIRLILNNVGPNNTPRLRREILINGVKRKVRDLAGVFNAVMFLPKDMRVVEGSPSERRYFLDHALCQSDARYAHAISEFGAVLSQRNALLKQLQERADDKHEIVFWDEKLCEHAAAMIAIRLRALKEINERAQPIHQHLTRNKEVIQLDYLPSFTLLAQQPETQENQPKANSLLDSQISEEEIKSAMLTTLQRKRSEEIARGTTTIGPHRDDFRFLTNDIDLRFYGSRGQNRTAMLSTQLAEVEWLRQKTGEYPVLLLDEVMAELDPIRREDLLNHLTAAHQAILTAADLNMFTEEFRSQAVLYQIADGIISPYQEK